mmetsp:Transcript_76911/g.89365  ORF Transcript_76911/g.89365 Transcript_76911/m.89365 type:complete len:186 (-) Transcript_76911:61-618(-)
MNIPGPKEQLDLDWMKNPPVMMTNLQGFLKTAPCHLCKRKKLVYGCFKDYIPTSCNKMFCTSCLEEVYKENILDIVGKSSSWVCPYKRGACVCKSCTGLADQKGIDISEQGPSKSQYTMLNKALTQSKIKQMLDFNADLIMKFQSNLQYLNNEELLFYLSVIQSNLESIYPVADFALHNKLYAKD